MQADELPEAKVHARRLSMLDLIRADLRRRVQVMEIIERSASQSTSVDIYSEAAVEPRPAKLSVRRWLRLILEPGSLATILHRMAHAAGEHHLPILPWMLMNLNLVLFGIDIAPDAEIGPGLFLIHPVGTSIGPARLGSNVSILQGVGIGSRGARDSRLDGMPVIGDHVWLMHRSSIGGPITVGSNSRVGAHALLIESCPPGSIVVPPKSRIFANPPADW